MVASFVCDMYVSNFVFEAAASLHRPSDAENESDAASSDKPPALCSASSGSDPATYSDSGPDGAFGSGGGDGSGSGDDDMVGTEQRPKAKATKEATPPAAAAVLKCAIPGCSAKSNDSGVHRAIIVLSMQWGAVSCLLFVCRFQCACVQVYSHIS